MLTVLGRSGDFYLILLENGDEAFIAVGALMLVVGYFAPMPPAAVTETEESKEVTV